jgi:ATP-binding cassette subfamily B protein
MASRENSKADSEAASELKLVENESLINVLATLPWNQPPLSWLTPEQQSQLQNRSQTHRYKLGEKIWSKQEGIYQFFIVSGKVRLREEGVGRQLATLEAGDWFGELHSSSVDFKAVAASKEVVVVRWDKALWAEFSTPQMIAFFCGEEEGEIGRGGEGETPWRQEEFSPVPPLKSPLLTETLREQRGGSFSGEVPCENVPWENTHRESGSSPHPPLPPNPTSRGPQSPPSSTSVSGYPFVSNSNTAAACLTMVAQKLDNPLQLEWVQRQLRGQRPKNVVEAAEKLGFVLRRLQVSWSELRSLSFPALLQWGGEQGKQGNWVVAYGVRGDRLIIANPKSSVSTCEGVSQVIAETAWDGQLWQVEVIQQQEKFNLNWFIPAVSKYKGLLGEVLLASFTLQLLGLATPLITQVVIDKVMVQESLPTLDVMAIALLSVSIFEAVLGILRLFIFTHTARRLDLSLSAQLFRHLMRLPLSYFESRRVGDTVARVQELEQIRQFLTGTALTVILDSIFAVVYLALMFYYNVQLTAVALAVLPLFAILTIVSTPILRGWLNETFNRSADSQSFLVETVTGIHSVKAHAAERVARDRWEGLFARFIRTGFKASTTSNISSNIGDFLTNLSSLLILWFGAKLVIEQKLTIGQLVAFQMLSGRVTGPLLRLVQLWQNLQQVLLSVDRIGDILNVAPEAEAGTGLVLPTLKGEVAL